MAEARRCYRESFGFDSQEFISNHTKFYYDKAHGYWMGLQQNREEQWVWLDGRNDTLG